MSAIAVELYFNFRSPYCYLASKTMFRIVEEHAVRLEWRPLGAWDGRSPPERAKAKMPLARQDVRRWCARMGIPFCPPPATTDPTRAGAASLLALELGLLKPYVQAVMHAEWGEGKDIGDAAVLADAAIQAGLDPGAALTASTDPRRLDQLARHWVQAQACGVFGVPSFVIGEEIFWGNDRLDFVLEHLAALRA